MAVKDQVEKKERTKNKAATKTIKKPASLLQEENLIREGIVGKKSSRKKASVKMISAEERHRLTQERAYFIAEQRGFQQSAALDDWLLAEKEVDASL